MAELTFGPESPEDYFRNQVQLAMEHQQLVARELTEFYVVKLLVRFVRPVPGSDAALGIRLAKAFQAGGHTQRDGLRLVGDESLFLAGFFSDSLKRSLVNVDYYISLGEYAYGSIPRDDALADVFEELAENFAAFVAVLDEVSAKSWLTSDRDVLRLYEKWLRTRSRRSGDLLVARGIVPNASIGSKLVQ